MVIRDTLNHLTAAALPYCRWCRSTASGSIKSFKTKRTLGKKIKQNRPLPQWFRMRTNNTIRYNAKRRHWRRTKIGI
ncbi:60S ribosomal protein L39, putative [Perkinsus marinus ATCC 50983]|uniref:60S ribosomal protein L39, putative n=1 Tax=Perkinsus marinus (strain ATCC 50983 / TXsc) TaxID=423536 RepID=C5LUC9_PERM5|nr:60S ribosomal protein L39, putative [Perkinsus marinus ATCC 50983]EEQ99662.1 60S ribosomal protein L39, putative [Perkinsus marinus ATCC 50983]|eukprot:XP_002766945.1 60S ribosomal protein L39, putative [Perkinsus marinus ATCC 50983]